jgi:myo-inositol 2-dehydrogenase / D-chiro-inositol 1-dehydrogenase
VIGLAVIGLGAMGRHHACNLARELGNVRLAMVVDSADGLAERVGDDLGVSWSTRVDDALAEPEVAGIVIAAPTPLHAELIERAAAVGKHVFCEKPAGLEVEAVERAAEAARRAGVLLQVGFQRRFDPDFVTARNKIESGEVGRVQMFRIAHRNRTPPHPGALEARLGSIFVDMTVHDFDTALWLIGAVDEVNAFEHTRNAVTVLRFRNGALGVIDNSRHAGYGFECSAEVVGTNCTLRIGARPHKPDVDVLNASGAVTSVAEDNIERHRAAYLEELRHFVRCLESGTEPSVGGQEAVAALRLALVAERCAG